MEPPQIFQYLDYRVYLGDWIQWKKGSEKGFSIRAFAKLPELSLSSSSFLSALLKGRKNLSQSLRLRFAWAMALSAREVEYFELLVQFNQARSAEERTHYYVQLSRHHGSRARRLEGEQHRLFSRWFYPVVWSWFALHQDQANPAQIAKALLPPISPSEVDEAIRILLELRLLKRQANGYALTDRHLATDKRFAAAEAEAHHRELLRLAQDQLERLPAEARQYNAMAFPVSEGGYERIRARMDAFRAELREVVEADEGADRVLAFSMQLFPCTRTVAAGRGRASVEAGNPEAA